MFILKVYTSALSLCHLIAPNPGAEPVSAHASSSHSAGLPTQTAEEPKARTEKVPSTPGGGGGHTPQDHADIPQGKSINLFIRIFYDKITFQQMCLHICSYNRKETALWVCIRKWRIYINICSYFQKETQYFEWSW